MCQQQLINIFTSTTLLLINLQRFDQDFLGDKTLKCEECWIDCWISWMAAAAIPANTLESESICRCLYLSCEVWVLQHCSTAALQPSQYHSEWLGCTLAVPGVVYTAKYICPSLQAGYWVLCGTVAGNCLNRNDKSPRLTDQHVGHLFSVQKQVKVPSWSSQVPPSWQGEEAQPSWPRSSIVNTCTSSILTRAVND